MTALTANSSVVGWAELIGVTFTAFMALSALFAWVVARMIDQKIDPLKIGQAVMDQRLDTIERELKPNGGSSVKDKVDLLVKQSSA